MNAKPSPPAEKYQVGWISAIRVEHVVACELLDEEYAPLLSRAGDTNSYTFGRIGQHNVVLACLPMGRYGEVSATSGAENMMRSFPALRFGLLVGVAGGAPNKDNDIRLGDIVVGVPMEQNGGVIHYNYGKAIQDGNFVRTGMLNSPPRLLLTAAQNLATSHERNGHNILATVDKILKNHRLKKKHQRPDSKHDVLFQSSFVHADGRQTCEEICYGMTDMVIARRVRTAEDDDPVVHYGLIASADQVMKDAYRRDQLIEEENVLCFEMEAAGLMNSFPCIVIRGICDYSDSHKNEQWQGYAAATAAAYAKELLSSIPPTEVANVDETALDRTQSGGAVFYNHGNVQNQVATQNVAGDLNFGHTVNNFSGTFSSQGNTYNGGTFNSQGGTMRF